MTAAALRPLAEALERAAGNPVRFWVRDDDAVAVTPALERLDATLAPAGAPLLLAAIPARATAELGAWAAARPRVTPCQHGWAHANHAGAGERACELGGVRDDDAVLAELAAGRAAMDAVFAGGWLPLLVPPWNRIRPSLVARLPSAGYAALSTFAGAGHAEAGALPVLDCDLDIIDWRNGRRCRDEAELCGRLVRLVEAARGAGAPVGLLLHHLAHDEAAWRFLEGLLPLLAGSPGARLVGAPALLAAR